MGHFRNEVEEIVVRPAFLKGDCSCSIAGSTGIGRVLRRGEEYAFRPFDGVPSYDEEDEDDTLLVLLCRSSMVSRGDKVEMELAKEACISEGLLLAVLFTLERDGVVSISSLCCCISIV